MSFQERYGTAARRARRAGPLLLQRAGVRWPVPCDGRSTASRRRSEAVRAVRPGTRPRRPRRRASSAPLGGAEAGHGGGGAVRRGRRAAAGSAMCAAGAWGRTSRARQSSCTRTAPRARPARSRAWTRPPRAGRRSCYGGWARWTRPSPSRCPTTRRTPRDFRRRRDGLDGRGDARRGTRATGGVDAPCCPRGGHAPRHLRELDALPGVSGTPPGSASAATRTPPWRTCASGTYALGGNATCSVCPAGRRVRTRMALISKRGASGAFAEAGSTQCTPCPPGSRVPQPRTRV